MNRVSMTPSQTVERGTTIEGKKRPYVCAHCRARAATPESLCRPLPLPGEAS